VYSLQGPSAYQILCTRHHGLYDARDRHAHRWENHLAALADRFAA
jgi:hypothetical protein